MEERAMPLGRETLVGAWVLGGFAAIGCGGTQFSEAAGMADSGRAGDAMLAPDGGATGSDAAGDAAADGVVGPAEAGPCAPLASTATDVYVDQTFAGSSPTGAKACPLPTVGAGLAAAANLIGQRTVHVAGAASGLVYKEAGSLTVAPGVVLKGDGPTETTIEAAGTCGDTTCAVVVEAGAVLDGFTVVSSGGDGVVTAAAAPAPVVRNVAANGSMLFGVRARGAAELGPNLSASNNGAGGLESPLASTGVLHVIGTANAFNANKGNGINLDGNATLSFEGGTANGNFQGIRLAGSPTTGHTITSLTATGNTGPGGIVAYGSQTIKLRTSVLLGNASAGLLFTYTSGNTLDLGTGPSDLGGNVFGAATASMRNGKAGLRLCNAGGNGSLVADGDAWSACPMVQQALACAQTISTYADVVFGAAATVVAPVTAGACAVGP